MNRAVKHTCRVIGSNVRAWRGWLAAGPITYRQLQTSGLFDTEYYLAQNSDVAEARLDPITHYLRSGAWEGRNPHPWFDTKYYLTKNPDVARAGVNPLVHYIRSGAQEQRDPHPFFDSSYYSKMNPDVVVADINPLIHYLQHGASEGRRPHPLAGSPDIGPKVGASGFRVPSPQTLGWEFVPEHILEWRLGTAVFGCRVVDVEGAVEVFRLKPDRPLEFTTVIQGSEVVVCRMNFGPPTRADMELVLDIHGEALRTPFGFRTVTSLEKRDEKGWLRVELNGFPPASGRRVHVRLTVKGGPGAAVDARGIWTWSGRVVGQIMFLRAAPCPRPLPGACARRPLTVVLGFEADGGAVRNFVEQRFGEVEPYYVRFDSVYRLWPTLWESQVVIFADPAPTPGDLPEGLDQLVFALHHAGVVTILLDSRRSGMEPGAERCAMEATIRQALRLREGTWHRFHYAALMDRTGDAVWVTHSLGGTPASLNQLPAVPGGMATARLVDLRASILTRRRPHVAIISVLYRKADVIGLFLDMLCRQRYDGPMTIVLVDDCSPDDSVARAQAHRCEGASAWPINMALRIIRNQENLGNCASRNRGVAAVEADVYVVIDCDCLLNQDFVAAHADQHALPSTGVVCGPINLESRGRDPVALVEHLEFHPEEILQEAQLQDDIQPDAFVNCVTRNFSIQRCHIPVEGLFDENFAYSARPSAGFGWEDVELGYRLYRAGVPIAFTERAFAVHVTHPSSVPEARQCVGSARNFRLLFDTHPELALVVRRWSTETARRIEAWARQLGVGDDPAVRHIVERFALHQARLGPFLQILPARKRRLRVLSYRWHAGHQYELHKLPYDFTLVTGLGERMTDVWSYEQRPLRPNVRFLPAPAVNARDYDLAILHFDENSLTPDLGTGTLGQDWGRAFRHFLREFQLPKVAICHGTPQFVGQYAATREPIEQFEIHEAERRWLVDVLRDVPVVVNSWQALDEWGFQKGRVIWHGFDPQEFPPATRRRQVLSHGEDSWRPHYRGKHVLQRVRDILGEETLIETSDHPQAVLRPRLGNEFARANFRAYVDWIRSFTVYLNTTIRSPMPRARAEAMMCGVIPVSLRNHDVEHFIRHGVNGFWGDSPEELAEYTVFLLRDPRVALRISEAARRTAMDVFNHDRYLTEWTALLTEVLA